MTTKAPVPIHATFFDVPAGTPPATCKGAAMGGTCTARIYYIENPRTGARTPIDCNVEGGEIPSETNDPSQLDMLAGDTANVHDGRGISHFFTCSDADMFTKGGAR